MSSWLAIEGVRPMALWRPPIDGVAFPTRGQLAFGVRRRSDHVHQGVDLFAPLGTRVHSPTDGVVQWAVRKWRGGFSNYGRVVVIESDQGPFVLLSHLDRVDVEEGQRVHMGHLLGTVGRTAFRRDDKTASFRWSKPHCHLEVAPAAYPMKSEASRLDPLPFFDRALPPRMTTPGNEAHEIKRSGPEIKTVATLGGGVVLVSLAATRLM